MKFGKSIGTQQDEDSELHYIDYKLLKGNIKEVVESLRLSGASEALTANTTFEESLANEIRKVNACFSQRQLSLMNQISSFADSLGEDAREKGSLLHMDGPFQRLVVILGDVDRLRKYAVWNAVAVVKILKKRRKQTGLGIEDVASERAGWLARQSFFSGSDFAELHTALESLGHLLLQIETPTSPTFKKELEAAQCPICLETISDMVELSCCHRFCWKCFVLGPIAYQPGEYRITQCPICRQDSSAGTGAGMPTTEGTLTRFLHTYFPQDTAGDTMQEMAQMAHMEGEEAAREMRDVVGELVKALHGDSQSAPCSPPLTAAACPSQSCSSSCGPRDFFHTLPARPQKSETETLGNAQKLQWLQLASSNDPFALDNAAICSLCWEPLLMEAVTTTPCKHHFHRICISRLDMPECPSCSSGLPFSWFLHASHPCYETGFRVSQPDRYRPAFPGGPSKGTAAYPLQRPPPTDLLGPCGMIMRSYLHCVMPSGDCSEEKDGLSGTSTAASPEDGADASSDSEDSSQASSSSSDRGEGSDSEADVSLGGDETRRRVLTSKGVGAKFAYSQLGKMVLADRGSCKAGSSSWAAGKQVLLIDAHV
jgi:hypothetical protein